MFYDNICKLNCDLLADCMQKRTYCTQSVVRFKKRTMDASSVVTYKIQCDFLANDAFGRRTPVWFFLMNQSEQNTLAEFRIAYYRILPNMTAFKCY